MTINDSRLAVTLKRISEASNGLANWMSESPRLIPGERVALQDEFTRVSSRAHVVAGLLKQPPTLGVVGAPRSGKTHLISSLANRGGAPLLVRFDGISQRLNVIRQIVPVGHRQYLGAAMRFTAKTRVLHRGFPVQLRVLGLVDIIAALGGAALTTIADSTAHALTAADVRAVHVAAERHVSASPVVGLTEADTLALRDYFTAHHGNDAYVQALTAGGYWDTLAELAPYLPEAQRVALLSPLWLSVTTADNLFARLQLALSALGYGRDAACTLDALVDPDPQSGQMVRRADSILGTRVLASILDDADRPIVVCSEFAQWHTIDRAALAAIVAEVKFQIDAPPGSVQEQADIIEFPGIAPPDGRVNRQGFSAAPLVASAYARAKQTLLHTRAIANAEVTALLACIEPGGSGIGELGPIVADWVHRTHGASPEARETSDAGLFIVHTKFDKLVADPTVRERIVDWGATITSVLHRDFARTSSWPLAWTPQRAFDSVSFVLAPAFKQSGLFDQGSEMKTSKLKSAMRERINRARASFLADDSVRRHVSDPISVFDDAVTAGDGGITRLAKSILAVCHARTKRRHLFSETTRLREQVLASSLRYIPGEISQAPYEQRHGMALLVARRLRAVAERQRLNALLSTISIADADLVEVFKDLTSRTRVRDGESSGLLARAAIDSWIGRIREVARRPATEALFDMPAAILRHLIDELVVGANRLDLEARIVRQIEGACGADLPDDARIEAAAICAAFAINGYLLHLGYDNLLANDHPRRRDQADSAVFSPRDPDRDGGDAAFNPELDQCSDWTLAYLAFVEENARELRERHISPEDVQRLSTCLAGLDSVQQGLSP